MLTAQGAFLKLEGGNIMIHGPGKITFKASMKELTGPSGVRPQLPRLPVPQDWPGVHSQQVNIANFIGVDTLTTEALAQVPYSVRDESGSRIASGVTSPAGDTQRIFTKEQEMIDLFIGDGDWRVFVDVKHAAPRPARFGDSTPPTGEPV